MGGSNRGQTNPIAPRLGVLQGQKLGLTIQIVIPEKNIYLTILVYKYIILYMKLITINVEDEEHTAIKLAATTAGLSIKDYLLRPADTTITKIDGGPSTSYSPVTIRETAEKLCKHGVPSTFCRFAKPGKPCK